MDPFAVLFVSGALLALTTDYLSRRNRRGAWRRLLVDTPCTRSDRLEPRFVRVSGRAQPAGEPLSAPVTDRPCLACETRLQVATTDGLGWIKAEELAAARPFWIEDDAGRVLVDASGPFVLLLGAQPACRAEGPVDDAQLARLAPLLPPDATATERPASVSRLAYVQAWLDAGGIVSVAGHAEREVHPTGETTALRGAPMRWVLRGRPGSPLLITDDPALCSTPGS